MSGGLSRAGWSWPRSRAKVSAGNCSRDSTRTPRLILAKPLRQRVLSGAPSLPARAKPRASCTIKRALIPSGQAGMQLPLPLHTLAQRTAASFPAPPVIKSTMPPVTAPGSASPSPAGGAIGQARKHSPQRVHASAIASPRALNSSKNPAAPASLIARLTIIRPPRYPAFPPEESQQWRQARGCFSLRSHPEGAARR